MDKKIEEMIERIEKAGYPLDAGLKDLLRELFKEAFNEKSELEKLIDELY